MEEPRPGQIDRARQLAKLHVAVSHRAAFAEALQVMRRQDAIADGPGQPFSARGHAVGRVVVFFFLTNRYFCSS